MLGAFTFNTSQRIMFENGALDQLQVHGADFLGNRPLVVTDKGIVNAGLLKPLVDTLLRANTAVTVYDDVTADPHLSVIEDALELGTPLQPTSVIGFGGGSSLDVAKLVALHLGSGEDINEAWGINNARGPRLPLILIPTTAGTGSEVTPISIITVGDDEKRGVVSPHLLPDLALLDPLLTLGLPAHVTAATGIDAMVHAIEAYTSKSPNNNPVSRTLAIEALRLLGANIEAAVFDPGNEKARGAMLLGSMLAGMAFANSPVAAVHALAYPIGGTFHVPHGLSNALVLPHVLRFNMSVSTEAYAELAPSLFPELAALADPTERARQMIERLSGLTEKLGLQTRLTEVGITENDLSRMAQDAMKQTRLLVNNPKALTEADAFKIYKAAL